MDTKEQPHKDNVGKVRMRWSFMPSPGTMFPPLPCVQQSGRSIKSSLWINDWLNHCALVSRSTSWPSLNIQCVQGINVPAVWSHIGLAYNQALGSHKRSLIHQSPCYTIDLSLRHTQGSKAMCRNLGQRPNMYFWFCNYDPQVEEKKFTIRSEKVSIIWSIKPL
jgi:hypothetical protein